MGDFRSFSDEQLDQWIAGSTETEMGALLAERERRSAQRALAQSAKSHQELIAEQQRLRSVVDSLATGQSDVKQSVDRLGRPKWIEWAILIATVIGLLISLAALLWR